MAFTPRVTLPGDKTPGHPFHPGPSPATMRQHNRTWGDCDIVITSVACEISRESVVFKEYEIYYGFMVCSTDLHAAFKEPGSSEVAGTVLTKLGAGREQTRRVLYLPPRGST
ncbi:hypothetical protein AVEN_78090-1 [Araneus ventricosus]|uniref:Uncharacterized protein n=1 Tax=Araneus ventricosus TaxID=182803 RepID=A0A4Y2F3L4_ARAVE|nr:hypothetical protein AVEN_78090-1 [Araneus ventricosus]